MCAACSGASMDRIHREYAKLYVLIVAQQSGAQSLPRKSAIAKYEKGDDKLKDKETWASTRRTEGAHARRVRRARGHQPGELKAHTHAECGAHGGTNPEN